MVDPRGPGSQRRRGSPEPPEGTPLKEERATRTSLQRSGARQEATDRMDLLRGGANLRLRQIWYKSENLKKL